MPEDENRTKNAIEEWKECRCLATVAFKMRFGIWGAGNLGSLIAVVVSVVKDVPWALLLPLPFVLMSLSLAAYLQSYQTAAHLRASALETGLQMTISSNLRSATPASRKWYNSYVRAWIALSCISFGFGLAKLLWYG